ncbi:MAG TPA: hypothetical protein VGQ83_36070 [Polyangia bacterium]
MRKTLLVLCALSALLCDARPGMAANVFINDEKVEALAKEVVLKNVDVRIDTKGNVFISAKGVKVTTSKGEETKPANATAEVSRRYYLVTMQSRTGATQYKVDLFINGKWTKQVHSKNAQEIAELTRYFKAGKNTVHLVATKDYGGGPRISSSPADTYDVLIGEGQESAGRILLEKKLVEFRRTADETENRQAAYTIEVR